MKKLRDLAIVIAVFVALVFPAKQSSAREPQKEYVCQSDANKSKRSTLELKLAKKKWKKQKRQLKKTLQDENKSWKVRLVFFPFLAPPKNIGIGKCVSADDARLAIKKALQYNHGIEHVVMQDFMPHHWIKVGVTDLAELVFMPITAEQLEALQDPSLSTADFQSLYHGLSQVRERKLPFGMGVQKIGPEK